MSGIVVITTKGGAKRDFVNALQKETNGAVKLAVLQNPRKKSLFKRVIDFYKKVGLSGIIPEVYYFLAVKLSLRKKNALRVLSARSEIKKAHNGYITDVVETDDVNEDSVYECVKSVDPDIIVIWGGYILKPRLLELAPYAVNIHFGFAPYYRGVNGIENALLNNDLEHVGITIHYAVSKVDAGKIIKVVTADHHMSPEKFFTSLNDRALGEYVSVIKDILEHKNVESIEQDISKGKNYFLKEWTYAKQNTLAEKIVKWQHQK